MSNGLSSELFCTTTAVDMTVNRLKFASQNKIMKTNMQLLGQQKKESMPLLNDNEILKIYRQHYIVYLVLSYIFVNNLMNILFMFSMKYKFFLDNYKFQLINEKGNYMIFL